MTDTTRYDFVPTHLAIDAMRDNGYRNTSYALAELMDNAIQAGARSVELLCGEDWVPVNKQRRNRIANIAVIDDGCGMDQDTLRMALQFGNGTRLDDRSGMGRFGMGLPSASISQCQRVDVWTWQGNPEEALYTYIDLAEIKTEGLREVPTPEVNGVPDSWRAAAEKVGSSGTVVVWSTLDRCMWHTARTIIDRSEAVIGRMYRRFLDEGRVSIRMAAFTNGRPREKLIDRYASVNDPMYVMVPSSTPSPYDQKRMFEPDGENWEDEYWPSDAEGVQHRVTVRFTVASDEVRAEPNAGRTLHGKHARHNIGVSIMRAGRELELDQSLVNGYDPRERWWGVEVDFPPGLDEVFGVTNNKQAALHFSEVTGNIETLLADEDRSVAEIKEELDESGDPSSPLVEIVHDIDRRLRRIRKAIEIQARGQRKSRKRHEHTAESQATEVTKKLQGEGHEGQSDADESLPAAERAEALAREFLDIGWTEDQAKQFSNTIVSEGIKYSFAEGELEGRSFFTVKPVAGEIVVKINTNHPAYENLVEVLEEDVDESTEREVIVDRLVRANRGLMLLLMAWARYEDEERRPEFREQLQDIRTDWGRVAARFLRGE